MGRPIHAPIDEAMSEAKLAAKLPVSLVPQPHGGALLAGGRPGHRGGGGRPSNAIRSAFRELLDEHGIGLLRQVLSGEIEYTMHGRCEHCGEISHGVRSGLALVPSVENQLRALDLAAKVGLGGKADTDAPARGVIVLGPVGMEAARRVAAEERAAASGGQSHATGEYEPPPEHEVLVIEEDLSTEVPRAAVAETLPDAALTKAQQLAARRRAAARERS